MSPRNPSSINFLANWRSRTKRRIEPDLQDFAGCLCGSDHRSCIGERRCHRFFTENVFTGVQCRNGGSPMALIVGTDTDCIEFVHFKHFVVAREGVLSRNAPLVSGLVRFTFDDVADGNDLKTPNFLVGPFGVRVRCHLSR